MLADSIPQKSSVLEVHKRLVQLISEEAEILEKTTSPSRIKRHTQIMDFLIELQAYTSKDLLVANCIQKEIL